MSRTFFGRERELARLQQLFEEAAGGGGPRMAVVVAHTGVGKTRLAQELYRWLSTHPRWDATDFWPDDLGLEQQSLKVNPDLPSELTVRPAFVWWGVRATSTIDRNASEVACIVEHCSRLRHLRKLLDPLVGAGELGRAALDVVSDLALPVPGLKTFFGLAQSAHDRLQQRKLGSAEAEGREQKELADELLVPHFMNDLPTSRARGGMRQRWRRSSSGRLRFGRGSKLPSSAAIQATRQRN